jgi:hypothetical protein
VEELHEQPRASPSSRVSTVARMHMGLRGCCWRRHPFAASVPSFSLLHTGCRCRRLLETVLLVDAIPFSNKKIRFVMRDWLLLCTCPHMESYVHVSFFPLLYQLEGRGGQCPISCNAMLRSCFFFFFEIDHALNWEGLVAVWIVKAKDASYP